MNTVTDGLRKKLTPSFERSSVGSEPSSSVAVLPAANGARGWHCPPLAVGVPHVIVLVLMLLMP